MVQAQTAESVVRSHCFAIASTEQESAPSPLAGQEPPKAFLRFAMSMNKFCSTVLGFDRVGKIGFKARGESMSVWTFADEPTPETLTKIYAAEMELMNANPNMLFDFAVKFDTVPEPPGFYIIMG